MADLCEIVIIIALVVCSVFFFFSCAHIYIHDKITIKLKSRKEVTVVAYLSVFSYTNYQFFSTLIDADDYQEASINRDDMFAKHAVIASLYFRAK